MAHNKPRANAFHFYGGKKRKGSVAWSFANFDDSIKLPPNIKEVNEAKYRSFCDLAKDPFFRMEVTHNGRLRWMKWNTYYLFGSLRGAYRR